MEQERSLGKSTLLYKTFLKWCMAWTMQVQISTSFVRFEEFAKNLWPHTLSKFFFWALSELKWQSFSMLAGFSMLADMLTKQTAAPQK